MLLTFSDCEVKHDNAIFFQREWGVYDLAIGKSVKSVFGGPADREAFGITDDFRAKIIPSPLVGEG